MRDKGFTLIELIFALLIIGVILSYAITNISNSISKSALTKLKSDVLLINNGIKNTLEKQLFENKSKSLDKLEDDEALLFSNILDTPFKNSTKKYAWSKNDNAEYSFNFGNGFVTFEYDNELFVFTCDSTNEICKEVLR